MQTHSPEPQPPSAQTGWEPAAAKQGWLARADLDGASATEWHTVGAQEYIHAPNGNFWRTEPSPLIWLMKKSAPSLQTSQKLTQGHTDCRDIPLNEHNPK